MRKQIIKLIIVVLFLICVLMLSSCEERDELYIDGVQYEYLYDSDTYGVKEITFFAGFNVEILSEINGKPVTTLSGEMQWLKLPAIVRNIIIPDTITYVENYFVRYCSYIQYNEDEDGYYLGTNDNPYYLFVKPKEDNVATAFSYVKSVNMDSELKGTPALVPYSTHGPDVINCKINEKTVLIMEGAFSGCQKLKSITIPSNIKSIAPYTFANCNNLETVILEEGVERIECGAFHRCINLKNISFPSTIREIESLAFSYCEGIEIFEIPYGVESLGTIFWSCNNLKEIYVPSTVKSIYLLSQYCEALERIEVSQDNPYYSSIDGNLYSNDGTVLIEYASGKQEKTFKIPEGVTKICENVFYCAMYLENLVIPESVVEIERGFRTDYVDNVYYCGSRTMWNDINFYNSIQFSHANIYTNCDYDADYDAE